MSLSGGHWIWSFSLRFFYMFFLLVILITINRGADYLRDVIKIFIKNFGFWLIAGSIGFGTFYSLLCYSADHALIPHIDYPILKDAPACVLFIIMGSITFRALLLLIVPPQYLSKAN